MKVTQEDSDFDELMNEEEYGEQVATLEKLGMHELADDTIAVGVEGEDSSVESPGAASGDSPPQNLNSPPRCDTCGKLAKHQPANDGKFYCKSHAPEELLE